MGVRIFVLLLMVIGLRQVHAEPEQSSALPKDIVAMIAPKGETQGKNKGCCGYPLVGKGEWNLRFYWMAMQDRFNDSVFRRDFAEEDIYTRRGFYLGTFPARYARALLMEGSGRLSDGRILNYAGRCRYGIGYCFHEISKTRYPYGRGAGRRALVAFRSVAIDPGLVTIGEVLYIPEFDGLKLPSGAVHDGCVRADDTGGNIKKRKMDFFVVTYENFLDLRTKLWGATTITPHVEHPRCRYLKRIGRPLDYLLK
jgi:3D (Asp-Asp-Asp) domain-containing protein